MPIWRLKPLVMAVLLIAAAPVPNETGRLVSRVLNAIAARGDRQANFVEQRSLAALAAPQTSSGLLRYYRNGTLEKRTDQPSPELVLVEKDRLVITEGNNTPRVIDLNSQPGLRTVIDAIRAPLAGDAEKLDDGYEIKATGDFTDWQLRLVPRESDAPRLVRDIMIEGASGDIYRITIRQMNGDVDDITLNPLP